MKIKSQISLKPLFAKYKLSRPHYIYGGYMNNIRSLTKFHIILSATSGSSCYHMYILYIYIYIYMIIILTLLCMGIHIRVLTKVTQFLPKGIRWIHLFAEVMLYVTHTRG